MLAAKPGKSSVAERRLEKSFVALQSALTGGDLIKAVFALLSATVSCDFVNVFLRNERRVNADISFLLIDSRGRQFTAAQRDAFFHAHPGMPTLMANPGIRFVNTRETLPPEKILTSTQFYREVMQVAGFRHAVGMFFWDQPPTVPVAVFSLCRAPGRPDFEPAEIACLERLHGQINAALRRVHEVEAERAIQDELEVALRRNPRAVCVLDWDLRVAAANPAAREVAMRWSEKFDPALKSPRFVLPTLLRESCLQLKSAWLESLRTNPEAGLPKRLLVRHPKSASLQASVSLQLHHARHLGRPGFLIELQHPERAATTAEGGQDLLRRLTPREQRLVQLLASGKTNQTIADETGHALGSVKNALHAIFIKLAVHSRTELLVRIAQTARRGAKKRSL